MKDEKLDVDRLERTLCCRLSPRWWSHAQRCASQDGGNRQDDSYFLNFVLHADFNTCGRAQFPVNVEAIENGVLEGRFLVQMDEAVNISVPTTNRHDAPASNAMHKLLLTDGVQQVCALEYRPLSFLRGAGGLAAGCKLSLSNVVVRGGMALLTPETCQLLGGGAERLERARQRLAEHCAKPAVGRRAVYAGIDQMRAALLEVAFDPGEAERDTSGEARDAEAASSTRREGELFPDRRPLMEPPVPARGISTDPRLSPSAGPGPASSSASKRRRSDPPPRAAQGTPEDPICIDDELSPTPPEPLAGSEGPLALAVPLPLPAPASAQQQVWSDSDDGLDVEALCAARLRPPPATEEALLRPAPALHEILNPRGAVQPRLQPFPRAPLAVSDPAEVRRALSGEGRENVDSVNGKPLGVAKSQEDSASVASSRPAPTRSAARALDEDESLFEDLIDAEEAGPEAACAVRPSPPAPSLDYLSHLEARCRTSRLPAQGTVWGLVRQTRGRLSFADPCTGVPSFHLALVVEDGSAARAAELGSAFVRDFFELEAADVQRQLAAGGEGAAQLRELSRALTQLLAEYVGLMRVCMRWRPEEGDVKIEIADLMGEAPPPRRCP